MDFVKMSHRFPTGFLGAGAVLLAMSNQSITGIIAVSGLVGVDIALSFVKNSKLLQESKKLAESQENISRLQKNELQLIGDLEASKIQITKLEAERKEYQDRVSFLRTISTDTFPILNNQIDGCIKLSTEKIDHLSKQFGEIVTEINHAMNVKCNGGSLDEENAQHKEQHRLETIKMERKLKQVVSSLKEMLAVKQKSLQELLSIGSFIKKLETMAKDVGYISNQISLLSLNAAIEASHAGKAGSGFAAVAVEIKTFSKRSREICDGITTAIKKINEGFAGITKTSRLSSDQETRLVNDANVTIHEVIQQHELTTRKLDEASEKFIDISKHIGSEVENAVVCLQFQDRVSQILNHVRQNMNELSSLITSREEVDIKQFVENMVAIFATFSERNTHGDLLGEGMNDDMQELEGGEVTFF